MFAAVSGEISPILLLPSVSKIITLLFVLLSFRRLTALASPIPMAVPSLISPLAAISALTLFNRLISEAWSVVIGHCVNDSPAKIVRPILSSGRPDINSVATLLAASILFGFKSSASILVETSTASIMSMPSTCLLPQLLLVCGRASIITNKINISMRKTVGRPINFVFQL